jgi:hypothetical protein
MDKKIPRQYQFTIDSDCKENGIEIIYQTDEMAEASR